MYKKTYPVLITDLSGVAVLVNIGQQVYQSSPFSTGKGNATDNSRCTDV
jgi:hypothetical protein